MFSRAYVVSCVHSVTVLNAVFCMTCSLSALLPTETTGPLSRVYNHLPTTATNHYFLLAYIHGAVLTLDANQPSLQN